MGFMRVMLVVNLECFAQLVKNEKKIKKTLCTVA